MSDRKLSVLAVIAVVMAGLAVLQSRMNQKVNVVDFESSPLIEGLDINAVSSIKVTGASGEETTTLSRSGSNFVVAEKDNYPADFSKINRLINNCLDIRTYDLITNNPVNHADLKVTPETASYVVSFLDKEDKDIVAFAISETNEDGNAFVRLLSSNDVFSIKSPPMINTRPMDYINTQLFEVERNKIESVSVRSEEDVYILTSPEGSDEIKLETMPEGKQLKQTVYTSVFGALSSVRFEDVLGAANTPEDAQFDTVYTCTLYDETVYKLVLAKKDEKTYAKLSADFLDKTPVEKERRVESEEELKEKEAKLLAIDNVTSFNEKHQNWVYVIPAYKAGDLMKPLSELVEDVPEPETEDIAVTEDSETETMPEMPAETVE